MNKQTHAGLMLVGALAVGAFAHRIAGQEAAILGLSMLELALLSAAVGAVATRTLT